MVGQGRLKAAIAALVVAVGWGQAAEASGPTATAPWYLDPYGGDPPDMKAFYAGRVGIVMPMAPRPQLFISWRLLHGQKVGQEAGDALATPCCGTPFWLTYSDDGGVTGWVKARLAVPGAAKLDRIETDRAGPDHTSITNCFDEAFDLASETLKDRAARYGAGSGEVRAWLAMQDAVFASCSESGVALPAALPGAPAWLAQDRAYQVAAKALYDGRNAEAAQRFRAISKDAGSPWRGRGVYLAARALTRAALAEKTAASLAAADAAVAELAATPPGTFGRGEVKGLRGVLAYHLRRDSYFAQLEQELSQPELTAYAAVAFRDFANLSDVAARKPEVMDWMATLRTAGAGGSSETVAQQIARLTTERRAPLAHARARWEASHDPAWLIAALSLADPGDAEAATLAREAEAVSPNSPAWLSVQYHLMRLSLGAAPAAQSRQRLDAILARKDLSLSDRNVFTAQRAQVAADLGDFVRHALRRRLCIELYQGALDGPRPAVPGCARGRWDTDEVQPSGIYDGAGDRGTTGFGEDARAIIDRAPLAVRIALAADARLPAALRLDVALTSYGRAVELQDNAAIDSLARDLVTLLPLMAGDFKGVAAARPGPGKRFAEFLVLAKIPGLRTDLIAPYLRPEGQRVADFQEYWTDWIVAPGPGVAGARPPPLANYQTAGTGVIVPYDGGPGTPDAFTDLTCLGECGRGAAPLRLPDFIAAGRAQAAAERRHFLTSESRYGKPPPAVPPGGVSTWDEMLAYARAHPADPRMPEALYWLVHVGRFGGSHNRSGQRAFVLLHARYAGSSWAKRTPYYYD